MESKAGDAQALQIAAHHGRQAQIPERAGEHDRVRRAELVSQCEKRDIECAGRRECIALCNGFGVVGGQVQRGQGEHFDLRIRNLPDQPLRKAQRAGVCAADAAVDK